MECQTCRWWREIQKSSFGHCHRYPPSIPNEPNGEFGWIPVTCEGEFCGEYAEAPTDSTTAAT